MNRLPVTCRRRIRIHAAFVQRVSARRDDDRRAEALRGGECVAALLQAGQAFSEGVLSSAVSMQQVDHREASRLIARIGRRQIDSRLTIGRVALEIALERFAMDDDLFDRSRGRSRGLGPAPLRAYDSGRTCLEDHHRNNSGHHARGRHRLHDHPSDRVILVPIRLCSVALPGLGPTTTIRCWPSVDADCFQTQASCGVIRSECYSARACRRRKSFRKTPRSSSGEIC